LHNVDFLIVCAVAWHLLGAVWIVAAHSVKANKSCESTSRWIQHILPSVVGFFLLFHGWRYNFFLGRLYHSPAVQVLGTMLAIAGLLFAAWARLHLGKNWSAAVTSKEGHELVRSGPYRIVRHPLYAGLFLAVLGTSLTAETGDAFIGLLVMSAAYLLKLRREDDLLAAEFGTQYEMYCREVPALLPCQFLRFTRDSGKQVTIRGEVHQVRSLSSAHQHTPPPHQLVEVRLVENRKGTSQSLPRLAALVD
jgi:protein-S-isoprenylcysteine O-methyltransferase Ste14